MQSYEIGDILKCRKHGRLWIVYGYSLLHPNKLRLRQSRNGRFFTIYDYPKFYDLFSRASACK